MTFEALPNHPQLDALERTLITSPLACTTKACSCCANSFIPPLRLM
ncbi:hypothetical protein [Marinobacterium sp. xm-d-579]